MKTGRIRTLVIGLLIAVLSIGQLAETYAAPILGNKKDLQVGDQGEFYGIHGKIVDEDSGDELVFATIRVKGTNIATVTNSDGEFLIKIPKDVNATMLQFSYLGYKNLEVKISDLKPEKNKIQMTQAKIEISEVKVRPLDGDMIIAEVLKNIPNNYETNSNLMTGFYREAIKQKRSYVAIAEAVVDIYKSPYDAEMRRDFVKVYKGRKSMDVKKMDTVMFKLQGGPVTAMLLDVVKNPYTLLDKEQEAYYDYEFVNMITINDKVNYVISFKQKENIDYPLYEGKIYVDMMSMAITGAEFSLNMENQEAAASLFLRKKPLGMKLIPESANYLVNYSEYDGKWYFNYARGEVEFTCDWDKKLFNTNYSTMLEIAITDRKAGEAVKFSSNERIKSNEVFTEKVVYFDDADFWGSYNYIEPDESIESAISKLSRKLKNRTEE